MIRTLLSFGAAAGLVVVLPMAVALAAPGASGAIETPLAGYLVMILALSLIFIGVKRHRDLALGGVIRFGPAFLVGLGIGALASVVYVIGWEISLAATHFAFVDSYARATLDAARAKGASPAALARVADQMASFKAQYADPLYRLPMTFVEIFPVAVVIALISAALLRNSRFLPARRRAARTAASA